MAAWGCGNPDQGCHVTVAARTHTSSLSLLVDGRVGSYVPNGRLGISSSSLAATFWQVNRPRPGQITWYKTGHPQGP